ncbi:MAG: OmpH family outer membrane protein [Nitrospirota bacterium]
MKRIIAGVVIFLFMTAGLVFAQETVKIGYVDMRKAMSESKAGKTALSKLEKTAKEKQTKIEKEKKKIVSLQEAFEKKAATMTDEEKQTKQKEFKEKVDAFEKMVNETQKEFTETQAEYSKKIHASMKEAVDDVAKAENFTMILDNKDSAVLYAKSGLDRTDAVIKKMNEQ